MNKTTHRIITEWRQPIGESPSQVIIKHVASRLAGAGYCREAGGAPGRSTAEPLRANLPAGSGAAFRGDGASHRAGPRAGRLWLLLLVLGITSPTFPQTGVYALNGGTANPSSLTETTSTADQSGILVYNAGNQDTR